MPHKHKRKREDDKSSFDLPPTSRAKPLSVLTSKSKPSSNKDGTSKQRRPNSRKETDDTPKSFARLMAFQTTGKRIPSGLDDGIVTKKKKKGKKQQPAEDVTANTSSATVASSSGSDLVIEGSQLTSTTTNKTSAIPKILPHERLSDFSLRVDQSLPLHSIAQKPSASSSLKIKAPLTKHNKRLARMQREWRSTESKLREKQADADAELDDQREEEGLLWLGVADSKRKRKGGDGDSDGGDPWKVLEKKRREEGVEVRQRNLQDVVLAPPVLKPVKNLFKERGERSSHTSGGDGGGGGRGGGLQRGMAKSIVT